MEISQEQLIINHPNLMQKQIFQQETVASNQQDVEAQHSKKSDDNRLRKSEPDYKSFKPSTMQPSANFENHLDLLSDTDDEEERLDCVHDIHRHMDGAEADAEEEEEDYY